MMIFMRNSVAALGMTALLMAPSAGAAVTYSYYFPEPLYTVDPGDSVEVPVYLQETLDDPLVDISLFASDNGIVYASLVLWVDGDNVSFSSFVPDAAWEFSDALDSGGGMYDVVLFSSIDTSVTGTPDALDPAISRIMLGNLVFQAIGPDGSSSSILAWLDGSRGILAADDTIVSEAFSADAVITVVPEPSAAGAVGVVGMAMLRRRPRPDAKEK